MSFLIDPPMLFVFGAALYFAGKKFELERLAKITIGLIIVLAVISFSSLLYAGIFPCVFPIICNCPADSKECQDLSKKLCIDCTAKMNGSAFMLHTYGPIKPTGIYKAQFPDLFVAFIFLIIYPLALFAGYASALLFSKKRKRRLLSGSRSYEDVNSRLKIAKNPSYSIVRYPDNQNNISNLREAVEEAVMKLNPNGMKGFVSPNDKVLIKANICGGNPTKSATYTSLELVGYIVDMVREAGGEPFVCDADMVWTKFWVAVKAEGWDKWAEKKKVKLKNLSETELVYFDFGEDSIFGQNERPNHEVVSKEVLDADVIISVPKMKTHLSTSVSLGMKNMYGTLPNEDKAYYHQKSAVQELLYWVNYAFRPTLTIIDGSEGGEAEGPLAAQSVQYNTIIASNNVVWADAIASKLMGFDPFKDIKFLRNARDKMGDERSLLTSIPNDLYLTAPQLISKWELPANIKDGNWERADPSSVEETQNFIENAYGIPGAATLYNIGADFLLLDAANLPYWNTIQRALMQIMFAPRFWTEKTLETGASRNRTRLNLAIFSILALISLYFFFKNGYIPGTSSKNFLSDLNKSLGIILGFSLALILGALFARMMETKHLIAITFSSLIIAYLVETYAPIAGWWKYVHEADGILGGISWLQAPPNWPLFAVPLFTITLVGISYHIVMPTLFSLKGRRFRLVPYVVITLGIFAFLLFGNYVKLDNTDISKMMIIYGIMSILALYFNERNDLDWNLAVTLTAVALGFLMEYFGMMADYWSYPGNIKPTMPVFLTLSWVLNIWSIGGLALIFGKNMSQAFVKNQTFDPEDPQALCHRGDTFRAKCNYDKAIKCYNKSIEKDPNLAQAHHGKGIALACRGDFKNALKAYDDAIDLYRNMYPDSAGDQVARALYQSAVAIRNLKGPKEAVKAFKEALAYSKRNMKANPRIAETYADILVDYALSCQEMGNYSDSIDLFKDGMDHIKNLIPDQKLADLLDFMGFSYLDWAVTDASDNTPYEKALDYFNTAIDLSSEDSDKMWWSAAQWGIGCAMEKLGDHDKSLNALHNATLYLPSRNAAPAWNDKGDVLWDQGYYADALEAYEKAVELYSEFTEGAKSSQGWRVKEDACYKIAAKAHKGKGDAHYKAGLQAHKRKVEEHDTICNQTPKMNEDDDLESREFNYAFKAYSRAIQFLDKYVVESDAKSGKGNILSTMGRYKEAIKAYSDAISIASKREKREACGEPPMFQGNKGLLVKAYIGKGNVHAKMGELEESLIEYDRSIEINNRNIFAWNNKGIAYACLGKLDTVWYAKAVEAYEKAINVNGQYPDALFNNGLALTSQSEYDAAIECYKMIIDRNPRDLEAMNNKGVVLCKQEKFDEAIKTFEQAINVNRRYANAFYNEGLAQHKVLKYLNAINCYDKAIDLDSRDPDAPNNKGVVLYEQGKYDEAVECYDIAIKANPRFAGAWYNKGLAFYAQHRYSEAFHCFEIAIELNPHLLRAWHMKGMTLKAQNKESEAQSSFKKIIDMAPDYWNTERDKSQLPNPEISEAHQEGEKLNSRYDEARQQRAAYFAIMRHIAR